MEFGFRVREFGNLELESTPISPDLKRKLDIIHKRKKNGSIICQKKKSNKTISQSSNLPVSMFSL